MGAGGDSGGSGKRGFFSSAVDWASTLTAGDIGHTVLDVGGLVPGWGEAADAANAAWYAGEGNYTDALFSAISLVPVAGDIIGKGGKVAMRVINAGGPAAVKAAKELLGQLNDIGIDNLKSIFNKFLPKDLAEKMCKELDDLVAKLEKVIKGEADEAGEAGAVITGSGKTVVYRVEGLPNTRITIGEGGQVAIQGDQTLFLNFGDKARAEEFLAKRLDQGMPGAQMKSFEVPTSFLDDLKLAAVPESMAKQFPGRPIVVDPTKAADQFGLRPEQFKALEEAIIKDSGRQH